MACGCFQVLQAMSNGSAMRSGIGAIWVGAISATISTLISRLDCCGDLPPSVSGYEPCHGSGNESRRWRHDRGVYRCGPRLRRPQARSDPNLSSLYFFVIAVTSALIDGFGLLGTEAKPLAGATARRRVARRRWARARPLLRLRTEPGAPAPRKRPPIDLSQSQPLLERCDTLYLTLLMTIRYIMGNNLLRLNTH